MGQSGLKSALAGTSLCEIVTDAPGFAQKLGSRAALFDVASARKSKVTGFEASQPVEAAIHCRSDITCSWHTTCEACLL
jgi:hypothetical protein